MKISAILVLLFFILRHNVHAAIQSFNEFLHYPEKQVIYNKEYSFKDGNMVFAVCDELARGKNCTIMQNRFPDGKSQRSCNVFLNVDQRNAELTDKTFVAAFGLDNAILMSGETGRTKLFKLLTVNIDNCQTGGFTLPDPSLKIYDQLFYNDKIVTHNDTFEIILKNSNLSNGARNFESSIFVNSRGEIEKNATEFIKIGTLTIRSIWPIGEGLPNQSYVYTKDVEGKYILVIHKHDGHDKELATYNTDLLVFISAVNDLITLCANSSVTCTQYDKEGNEKFRVTLGDKEKLSVRHLYNLPRGGALILLSEYEKSDYEVDFTKVIDYSVVKVNSKGKKVGSIHLNNELVKTDNMAKVGANPYVWKNGNDEYCAAVIGLGLEQTNPDIEPSDLKIAVNCFKEADLRA